MSYCQKLLRRDFASSYFIRIREVQPGKVGERVDAERLHRDGRAGGEPRSVEREENRLVGRRAVVVESADSSAVCEVIKSAVRFVHRPAARTVLQLVVDVVRRPRLRLRRREGYVRDLHRSRGKTVPRDSVHRLEKRLGKRQRVEVFAPTVLHRQNPRLEDDRVRKKIADAVAVPEPVEVDRRRPVFEFDRGREGKERFFRVAPRVVRGREVAAERVRDFIIPVASARADETRLTVDVEDVREDRAALHVKRADLRELRRRHERQRQFVGARRRDDEHDLTRNFHDGLRPTFDRRTGGADDGPRLTGKRLFDLASVFFEFDFDNAHGATRRRRFYYELPLVLEISLLNGNEKEPSAR